MSKSPVQRQRRSLKSHRRRQVRGHPRPSPHHTVNRFLHIGERLLHLTQDISSALAGQFRTRRTAALRDALQNIFVNQIFPLRMLAYAMIGICGLVCENVRICRAR